MSYGKRLKAKTVVQIDMSYATVGKNRDISLGLVGDVGAILAAVTQAASGRLGNGAGENASPGSTSCGPRRRSFYDVRLPTILNDSIPIHPLRLAYELNEFLTEKHGLHR